MKPIIKCKDCGTPVKEGEFAVGDIAWRKGYGIGRCAKVKIFEASPNLVNTGFVYKVLALGCSKEKSTLSFNFVCQDDLYKSLEDLQLECRKEIENPIIEDLT